VPGVPLRNRRFFAMNLALVTVAACSGDDLVLPSDNASARLELVSGNDQVAVAGLSLTDSLVVRLVDPAGSGIADRSVTWTVSGGGGTADPETGTTDGQGYASSKWTLGPSAGQNTVDAVVQGVGTVRFSATGRTDDGSPGPDPDRSRVAVDPASIQAGAGTATVTVRVRDANGDPVEGATVELQATGGGNTLTQPSGSTGSDGVATGTLSSTEPGTKTISAQVNGSVQVTQTADVTVSAASETIVERIEGDNQSVPAGAPVPVRPAVRAVDGQGRPVAGVGVTFVVTGGGGSVDAADQTTNSEGIARVGTWTLGTSPGSNTLEARAGSLQGSPVVFTAEGTPSGGVDHFVFRVQPHDVDEDELFTVEVAMVDADGSVVPLSGIEIYLGLFKDGSDTPTNKHLLGDRFRSTENGIAVFPDLGVTKDGHYRFRALSDQLPALGPHGPQPYLFSDLFEVD
jgi:adhesin/invasin